jgi:hypothetical protein
LEMESVRTPSELVRSRYPWKQQTHQHKVALESHRDLVSAAFKHFSPCTNSIAFVAASWDFQLVCWACPLHEEKKTMSMKLVQNFFSRVMSAAHPKRE